MPDKLALALSALLIVTPAETSAQRYGGRMYGRPVVGAWHGGYGYRPAYYGNRGWLGYRPAYYGYRGYYPHYYGYPGYYWAGVLGAVLGSVIAPPYVYAPPPPPVIVYAPPPAPPPMQHCADGSTVPAGSYCPPSPAPAPIPPPPAAIPRPAPERG